MIKIYPAGPEKVQTIHDLALNSWPQAYQDILSHKQIEYMMHLMYSIDALKSIWSNPRNEFILAYDITTPVGFALFHPKDNWPEEYRLSKIYILPSQKGKGVGKQMMEYIFSRLRLMGISILELNVNRFNPAKEFYLKMGFVFTGEENIDIGNGFFMNDYVMQKTLMGPQ